MAFNLDKLKLSPTLVVRFKLPFSLGTDGRPVTLLVKPADENVNVAYAGKLAAASARWAPIPKELSDEAQRELNLRRTSEIYYDTVIVGWEGVLDSEGKEPPFTEENLRDLLLTMGAAIPDVVARLLVFLQRAQNFRDVEPEQIAKN